MYPAKQSTGGDEVDYQAQSDADTLTKANEIQADKPRHQKALNHIAQKTQQGASMVANHARRSLQRKVKGHMSKVFGASETGSTPFNKAGQSGGTPFDQAGGQ